MFSSSSGSTGGPGSSSTDTTIIRITSTNTNKDSTPSIVATAAAAHPSVLRAPTMMGTRVKERVLGRWDNRSREGGRMAAV